MLSLRGSIVFLISFMKSYMTNLTPQYNETQIYQETSVSLNNSDSHASHLSDIRSDTPCTKTGDQLPRFRRPGSAPSIPGPQAEPGAQPQIFLEADGVAEPRLTSGGEAEAPRLFA